MHGRRGSLSRVRRGRTGGPHARRIGPRFRRSTHARLRRVRRRPGEAHGRRRRSLRLWTRVRLPVHRGARRRWGRGGSAPGRCQPSRRPNSHGSVEDGVGDGIAPRRAQGQSLLAGRNDHPSGARARERRPARDGHECGHGISGAVRGTW